jgi:selenocysteine-specific elongation factor
MRIIGTAGHVDHGKSTLVRALTGIDPDRLKEEKAREMTLDLGFAHFELEGIGTISLIDVPGHRDFIENMLAGVGGIDAVVFVIAADEGVMPQTREHLAILDLLGIQSGVIALTKIDRLDDPEWIDLISADIRAVVAGTVLANAPIIPISAREQIGLAELLAALRELLKVTPLRVDRQQPRLWVDRVFTMAGFGTVVTGTLLDGSLKVGQEVSLQPGELRARIRGLQSHREPQTVITPGSRAAVNLAGVERREVLRGQLLCLPHSSKPSALIDVSFRHLKESPRPLRHHAEVKVFVGAAETMARVRLVGNEELLPGEEGWLQLHLAHPLPVNSGDRYILRYPSPGETIGGGMILDPRPGTRWRRLKPDILERFERLSKGLSAPDQSESIYQTRVQSLIRMLTTYHVAEPLRYGLAPETLRSQLKLERGEFKTFLMRVSEERLVQTTVNGQLALPHHHPRLTLAQQNTVEKLAELFNVSPLTPPSYKESEVVVGEGVLRYLIESGVYVQLSAEVLYNADYFNTLAQAIINVIRTEGKLEIKGLRDRYQTSRKYAQAILEYLDQIRWTRREGDDHVLGSAAPVDPEENRQI